VQTERRAVATADDFCQLVDILQTVHEQHNLVHRDVRLPNFFRHHKSDMVHTLLPLTPTLHNGAMNQRSSPSYT
jgi:hypothetical protein